MLHLNTLENFLKNIKLIDDLIKEKNI